MRKRYTYSYFPQPARYLWLLDVGKIVLKSEKVNRHFVFSRVVLKNRSQKALRRSVGGTAI